MRRSSTGLVLALSLLAGVVLCPCAWAEAGDFAEVDTSEYEAFEMSLEETTQLRALSLGKAIFEKLEKKYPANGEITLLKSRMAAAEYIAGQMQSELRKAKERELKTVAGQLFPEGNTKGTRTNAPITPARDFYEASATVFCSPLPMGSFEPHERTFLSRYYDLKLKTLVDSIANAGKALGIVDEDFKGMYDYVLVLPLLHASGEGAANVGLLPKSMRGSEQLNELSESCLLHYGFASRAMTLAKEAAQIKEQPFSEVEFYESAAKRCRDTRPKVAAECLSRAVELLPDNEADKIVSLRLEAVQMWLDSGKYMEAAGEARKAFEAYPENELAGKATWLHYYALSKTDDMDGLLSEIDAAISDERCAEYRVKLKYMKWYALRRKLETGPAVTTLENELLDEHGDDPIVAPVMLFKANDLMARQDYEKSYELFSNIVEKFPLSEAAAQAKKMMAKLKGRR